MEDLPNQVNTIRVSLEKFFKFVDQDKDYLARKDGSFNRKFSVISSAFEDFSVFAERLHENIEDSITIHRVIIQRNQNEDKEQILEGGQMLRRKLDKIGRYNQADF